jgi:phage baseplate assembly protein V
MIGPIENAMRLQAERAAGRRFVSKYGIVTNYDPNRYAVKVTLQPDGINTAYIPLAAQWAGNGWGFFAAPAIGAQVSVIFIDGALTAGYAECSFFNNSWRPLAVPSGELWIVHASGQFAKFTNDGKLTFGDGRGATAAFNGDGTMSTAASTWNHTGNVNIDGTVAITGSASVSETLTATTDVVGGGISLKNHLTTAVQPGSGVSGAPQ